MRTDEAIILAGGLGTRLRPLVHDVPKPLAPVGGRPFLAWLLDRLAQEGIRHVCLATGYMADRLETAIGHHWQGMEIEYSVESEPLGTGGALLQAVSRLRGNSVHVCNADTWLRYSLYDLEMLTCQQIGMALASVSEVGRYGAVTVAAGRVVRFQEKGGQGAGFINAGSYFFSDGGITALKRLTRRTSFSLEADFLYPMADAGGISAFLNTSDFIDIGVPEDYLRAQALFSQRGGDLENRWL